MNRNTSLHFQNTPSIDLPRSQFDLSCKHTTTFNEGDIVPLYVDFDILPADTVTMDLSMIVRMATPIYPVMDNCVMDTYAFFVPHRLVMEKWGEFWGENSDPWAAPMDIEIPHLTAPSNGWTEGTLADYMGVPTKISNIKACALPFRAYAKIFNDWFRNENTNNNCHIFMDEANRTGQNGNESGYSYVTGCELGGKPAKAAKLHDYYSSCLPQPQKGEPVKLPLGGLTPIGFEDGTTVPVTTSNTIHTTTYTNTPLKWATNSSSNLSGKYPIYGVTSGTGGRTLDNTQVSDAVTKSGMIDVIPSNLVASMTNIQGYVDLSQATAATVNQLRTAFAIQKYLENAGLHGTRYIEYIRSVFGVTSSDARLQRAEYLGGKRIPINMDSVLQTSATDQTSPQGNTAGYSCTIERDSVFTKSFEEHGTLMVVGVVRVEHSYQQGLERMWSRKSWQDFYNPFFAHLGEQGVLNKEIYAQGTDQDDEVFGYQERWAEYRFKPNRVSGYMRSNATGSLDVWHYADDYNELPRLSSGWMMEGTENIDRTIAVTSQLTHQFIGDFYFINKYSRAMPVYSVPGLIDHV